MRNMRPWLFLLATVVIPLLIFGVLVVVFDETGFAGKTLWDWLELLIIPVALAIGSVWFRFQTNFTERELAREKRHEEVLQLYIDKITELILQSNLARISNPRSPKLSIARTRTVTALKALEGDSVRINILLQFLRDAGLLNPVQDKPGILDNAALLAFDLRRADLSEALLRGTKLHRARLRRAVLVKSKLAGAALIQADLRQAHLKEADLTGANLQNANLRGADLTGANFSGADLRNADLSRAILAGTTLRKAVVTDAILPDGSRYRSESDLARFIKPALAPPPPSPDAERYKALLVMGQKLIEEVVNRKLGKPVGLRLILLRVVATTGQVAVVGASDKLRPAEQQTYIEVIQAAASQANRTRHITLLRLPQEADKRRAFKQQWNLSEAQIAALQNANFMLAWPMVDDKETIIGVLVLDSREKLSLTAMTSPELMAELTNIMYALRQLLLLEEG